MNDTMHDLKWYCETLWGVLALKIVLKLLSTITPTLIKLLRLSAALFQSSVGCGGLLETDRLHKFISC